MRQPKPRVARDEEKRDGKGERVERSGDPKGTDPMSAMPPLCHLRLVGVKFELCREVDRGAVADDMVIRARSRLRRDPSPPSSHEDGGSFRDGDESSADGHWSVMPALAKESFLPAAHTYCLPWRDQPGSGSRRRLSETTEA